MANSIEEHSSYDSDHDMEAVTIDTDTYGIRWNADGEIELYDIEDQDKITVNTAAEFRLLRIPGYPAEKDSFVTSRWMGAGELDISGLYEEGSRLASSRILVQQDGDRYVFMVDAELDDDAIDAILTGAGIYSTDPAYEEFREMVAGGFKTNYYYSGARRCTGPRRV